MNHKIKVPDPRIDLGMIIIKRPLMFAELTQCNKYRLKGGGKGDSYCIKQQWSATRPIQKRQQ